MQVTTVSAAHTVGVDESRAIKAGAQFEGILLNMVFGDLERTFSQLPGSREDGVSKSYESYAVEGLTSGMAKSGGVGLGRFIAKALVKHTKVKLRST
ncbi:MAG TPA: hypothetical protein VJ731_18045 [Terriglobales bacterium]|nr:hypothetical protein [Terriglobales bacterium]